MPKLLKRDNRPTCISLFSGCGGLDLGVEAAGFRVAVATDADKTCSETYAQNFPGVPYVVGKIGSIPTEKLLAAANLRPGGVDLLVGGPPCPAFSKSRFYLKEKPRALDDPVAAETVGGYLRVLRDVQPRAFLLENVRGLAYGVHREALEHIVNSATELGYTVKWQIVNAADYGAPQIRERCLVIGSRDGEVLSPLPTHAKSPEEAGMLPWVTAGAVLRDLDTEENASDEGHFAGGAHHDLLRGIPPGENYLHYTAERGHSEPVFKWRSRYWSFLLKLSPDMPSWTIQARRSNNMGPFHWRSRILRISEVKRLQTFPDDFDLVGNVERQWRQIGNAVPPILARRFAEALRTHLDQVQSSQLAA
ncbi:MULTISPECIES: DNA cytosine methyltransferase [unclassified Rhizobacter]|uniref:DNA cytosine methyltransferase n=1 Tax=unclassified Rhizobacter TaxID=2640088 RepID=UPI000A47B16B|nr:MULTISPECIES: DNA (cytosine-5-)-methyltransferase [unclassified Rhizobacter]